jgi:hypothetical protein
LSTIVPWHDPPAATPQKQEWEHKPQSSELAVERAFTFEDSVGSLLSRGIARGELRARHREPHVSRVELQQRNFGEPLDDVIVDLS